MRLPDALKIMEHSPDKREFILASGINTPMEVIILISTPNTNDITIMSLENKIGEAFAEIDQFEKRER